MEKATIRSNLTILMPDIKATHAKGLDYILGETNSYACHVCLRVLLHDSLHLRVR
jgi:hypothetical protein